MIPVLPDLSRPSSPKRQPEAHSIDCFQLLQPPSTFSTRRVADFELLYVELMLKPFVMQRPPLHHFVQVFYKIKLLFINRYMLTMLCPHIVPSKAGWDVQVYLSLSQCKSLHTSSRGCCDECLLPLPYFNIPANDNNNLW